MQEDSKFRTNLIISIVALTLAILAVGALYVRDLISNREGHIAGEMKSVRSDYKQVMTPEPGPVKSAGVTRSDTIQVPVKNDTSDPEKSLVKKNLTGMNPFGKGNGNITIYRSCKQCDTIVVFIDGEKAGILIYNFGEVPSCDANGTLSKSLVAGRHHISARLNDNESHDLMVTVTEGKCTVQKVF